MDVHLSTRLSHMYLLHGSQDKPLQYSKIYHCRRHFEHNACVDILKHVALLY